MPNTSSNTSINVKQAINSLINIMFLISYVKTATNKRLLISENHGDSNRYTPYRVNLIHTTHTLFTPVHVHHSYASYGRYSYVTTFHTDSTELDRFTAPEKKCSRLHLSVQLSGPRDPAQFVSQTQPLNQCT
jgi:hypothetical protein